MNTLRLAENISRLRKEKKITQDTLADFIGVTKASVSKWETGQCLPDILLLPELASFFDVSVDELIGYEPQLSSEQIQRTYADFRAAFASEPFDVVMKRVRETVKRYYSCYPFLLQMCVLYLNHAPLAKDPSMVADALSEAQKLCRHIVADCPDIAVSSDALTLKAMFDLQLGNAEDVIVSLESVLDPVRFSHQNDSLLIEAYHAAAKQEKALSFAQISIYLKILYLVGNSVQYLAINREDEEGCLSTIRRVDALADAYELDKLHPNALAQYNYQTALHYMKYGDEENAVLRLERYADNVLTLFETDDCMLHGDEYFNRIGTFIETLALGANPPRDQSLVRQSAIASLNNADLQPLYGNRKFQSILRRIGGVQWKS